ncbi:MAG: ThuA domain-containing protein [Clostridia bacterium]|nr:ThuA domain-containing protein [Clostridia bacterium]
MIKVTVWTENNQERFDERVKKVYPNGIYGQIASFLEKNDDMEVRVATQDMDECGLPDEVLESTDVLIWWAHAIHDLIPDELVKKIHNRVLRGMGIIFLHSAHFSKPFISLMGTTCSLKWREGDRERLWTVAPSHPIAKGIPEKIEIPVEEMYSERFDIPTPDEVVFIGWFAGGEVFRSGCTWNRGLGKVFYFQPGHETNPTYYIPEIQQIIINAVRWAYNEKIVEKIECPHVPVTPEQEWAENNK